MIVGKPKNLHLALVGENLLSSETNISCVSSITVLFFYSPLTALPLSYNFILPQIRHFHMQCDLGKVRNDISGSYHYVSLWTFLQQVNVNWQCLDITCCLLFYSQSLLCIQSYIEIKEEKHFPPCPIASHRPPIQNEMLVYCVWAFAWIMKMMVLHLVSLKFYSVGRPSQQTQIDVRSGPLLATSNRVYWHLWYRLCWK